MKYMIQIYLNDSMAQIAKLPEAERDSIYDEYRALSQAPGVIDGYQLEPARTATTVRVDDGETVTADGPFAGTKEPLGGYYLIEADNPGAAVELASRIPAARMGGAVEVRPIIDQRSRTRGNGTAQFPAPREGIVLTHFIVSDDVERSRRFYTEVLGGETVLDGEPAIVALANGWIIINGGGGPTADKPAVTLAPPADLNRVSAFLNIRVADIRAIYEQWTSRGAQFLTPPTDRGAEIRCYLRDPDGHLIEVGQSTRALPG
jgi:catechol 2,3-dioxygenase-like lactoylglutathione lyase family enzyme